MIILIPLVDPITSLKMADDVPRAGVGGLIFFINYKQSRELEFGLVIIYLNHTFCPLSGIRGETVYWIKHLIDTTRQNDSKHRKTVRHAWQLCAVKTNQIQFHLW